jgi:hypothetical protein
MSTITWELKALDPVTTRLRFTHEFTVPFDPAITAFDRNNFVNGWTHIINTGLTNFLFEKK